MSLRNFYGPGIGKELMSEVRQSNADSEDGEHFETPPPAGDPGRLTLHLRRKRQAAIMKQLLKRGGYGDLAKMVSIRHGD